MILAAFLPSFCSSVFNISVCSFIASLLLFDEICSTGLLKMSLSYIWVNIWVRVLLPEYRGYGRSAGSPSQRAITEDLIAFYDLLARRPEVDAQRVVFHGRSLGGGAVCDLARHRKPAAVILMSTFTSMKRMAPRYLVPGFMVERSSDRELQKIWPPAQR